MSQFRIKHGDGREYILDDVVEITPTDKSAEHSEQQREFEGNKNADD